jgi:hypothetical protein
VRKVVPFADRFVYILSLFVCRMAYAARTERNIERNGEAFISCPFRWLGIICTHFVPLSRRCVNKLTKIRIHILSFNAL